MTKKFFQALALMIGQIIGVGIFSLPFIAAKVGIVMMLFYFAILCTVVILFELLYGEVILRTKGKYRLPGYAGKYLGSWAKKLALFSDGLGLTAAIIAYVIVGGSFLGSILIPIFGGTIFLYILIFFAIGALLIYIGVQSIVQTESVLLVFFFVILGLVFYKGFSIINLNYLFIFDSKYFFLPYGAVLFSLVGSSIIPEVKELLIHKNKNLKKVIILATLIAAFISLFFTFLILSITGSETTPEAITGLKDYLTKGIVVLVLIFGILANFTSFLTVGLTFKKMLWYDFKINKNLSWTIACFLPLILYLFGFNDFIKIISLSGGFFLAISAILIIFIYFKAKIKGDLEPGYTMNLPKFFIYFLVLFFIVGAVYELISFIL